MGNLAQSEANKLQITIDHQFFKNPTLLQQEGKEYLKLCWGVDELEYDRWQAALYLYKQHKTEYIFLPDKSVFSLSGICSTMGTAEVFYEKYCYLISGEIHHRNGRKTRFHETEIWNLLFKLIKAEHEARLAGDHLGDIRPNNIFLNEDGKLKVASLSSWPQATTAYEKGIEKLPAYISPEDMDSLAKGLMQPSNREASDMFSVGLTLLSFANLTDYEILYEMSARRFDEEHFRQALQELMQSPAYSQICKSIVLNLCSPDSKQRMTQQELQGLLFKHQEKILKLESFLIDNAPSKLHQEVLRLRSFIESNPLLFANSHLVSEVGGSGIIFPEHLEVHKVTPEYVFGESKTIIKFLQ